MKIRIELLRSGTMLAKIKIEVIAEQIASAIYNRTSLLALKKR